MNLEDHLDQSNVNMVTCGGQATIPMVAAVRSVSERVPYAEIVASVASKSAGPGTRANIDEFTETTSRGIEVVGGAEKGKAIIEGGFPTSHPLKHMQKDLKLGLTMGDQLDQPLPLTASANEVFKHAKRLGYGDHDTSAVYIRARF